MLYPQLFGSSAGVQGPELMMMSAMMAAGRMRMTLTVEGPLHGHRGTVPSAAAAQRHTSKRLHDGSQAARFCFVLLNRCNLGSEIALWKALGF